MDEIKIKELLLKENYISDTDLAAAEAYAKAHQSSVVDYLISEGIISHEILGQAFAEYFNVPFADLAVYIPAKDDVVKLPEAVARQFEAVLIREDAKKVVVATTNPASKELVAAVAKVFPKKPCVVTYALPEEIAKTYLNYRKQLATRFSEIIEKGGKVAPEIIDQILEDAIALHASDIHFEPQEDIVITRFRVDGVLAEAGRIEKQYYENIVNRMKVQAKLRIDEHQAAQDGAVRLANTGLAADLRISIVPTLNGEKIVIRLLASYVRDILFSSLGLSMAHEQQLLKAAKKPFGMVIVTGPTGSGKTTSLYALVKNLATPEVNITTIEDPVEYRMAGINQIQVNNQTNLTFAKGLRSIARQDPDIILVGEIRDLETAEIAVNAALTGHMMLSTFHANDAVSAVPRLLDMGIEPFLLASTLDLIVAQRLVRRICDSCRISHQVTSAEIKQQSPAAAAYFKDKTVTLYSGKGCSVCHGTGYRGRIGVYEMLQITPELQNVIVTNPASTALADTATKQGFTTMWYDGMQKVLAGQTTLEELMRVVQAPR